MLKKWILSLLGLALIPVFSFALDVTLTDAISRPSSEFPIQPSLSKHGDQAYLVYEIALQTPEQVIAEIFANNNGKLESTAQLIGDLDFISIDNGFANRDFTRFTLIDDNPLPFTPNPNTVRIRLFDIVNGNFNQLAERTFDDFLPGSIFRPFFSAQGGVFSPDGQFIVMSYLTTEAPNTTIIRILKADDLLSPVASTTIIGGSKGPIFFSHCNENYVALTAYSNFFFEFDNTSAMAPSNLLIFKFKNNELTLIDRAPLPQQGGVPSFFNDGNKTLIGVGTVTAQPTGETSFFQFTQTFLPNDDKELRIYSFDGCKLKLILAENALNVCKNQTLAKNANLTVTAPIFSPRGWIMVNQQAADASTGFFNFFTFRKNQKENNLQFIKGLFVSPPFVYSTLSRNGKWLLVTGSDQSPNVNNINLYKISKQCCEKSSRIDF